MESTGDTLQNISDTAIWVAMYRAWESERPDAHFRDPFARRLAGPRGEAIVRSMPQGRTSAWAMVVRTVAFDGFVMRSVRERGVDTVLDLATGLDARPWRLELPAALRWVDVDLPAILAYKQRTLAGETPRCRYEARVLDLRDARARRELFEEIGASARQVLVLTEGLLIYLAEEDVAALAADLAAPPSFRWWALDLVAPALRLRLSKQWGGRLADANAPFRFAPAAGTRFFEPFGWREAEFHSSWEDSIRLGRTMPHAWLWRILASLAPAERRAEWRRYAGNVLLDRARTGPLASPAAQEPRENP